MKKLFLYAFLSFAISSYCQTAEDYFKSGLSKLRLEDHEGAIVEFTKFIKHIQPYLSEDTHPNIFIQIYSNRIDRSQDACA